LFVVYPFVFVFLFCTAGVFAVRAGPILTENVIKYLMKKPLRSHRPQQDFLGLISTGDKYAVASKGSWFAWEGAWLWTWKDWIDRRWMAKYTTDLPDLEEMMAKMKPYKRSKHTNEYIRSKGEDVMEAFSNDPMRCGGCGAKVGSTTVSRVLAAVHRRQMVRAAQLQLESPPPIDHDDAAVMPLPPANGHGGALVQTIDYFREMIADPYIFGKIVAVHALSDVHAMGATAMSALSLAVAPFAADEAVTESTLLHLLSGVSDVLQDEGVRMVGGHTCEGTELACGLSVQGFLDDPDRLLRKRGGKPGDKLVITKPIGTGALFAADMRAQCKGEYVVEAIESLIRSNVVASKAAMETTGVRSCTDVTGFGLVGHLLEMLMANEDDSTLEGIGAVLSIQSIPFLRGGLEASSNKIFSTLQSQNARNRRAVLNHAEAAEKHPVEYPLLYDPQTAGGLLFFVDPNECDAFVAHLRQLDVAAAVIGELEQYPPPVLQNSTQSNGNGNGGICTIGSGDAVTGQRIRIVP
jgi:selenide,water dikinase